MVNRSKQENKGKKYGWSYLYSEDGSGMKEWMQVEILGKSSDAYLVKTQTGRIKEITFESIYLDKLNE